MLEPTKLVDWKRYMWPGPKLLSDCVYMPLANQIEIVTLETKRLDCDLLMEVEGNMGCAM